MRLHIGHRGARGVLFLSAEDGEGAEAYARALWAAAAEGEGPVCNWRLLECGVLPLPARA
ncbi:hypothetical protein [Streptomyces sp. NPDC059247]|uniref:hypothetical protein n=1 Tax=Streptomyces sp. NPDC059247 TaxID=3346790 RepID=UPI003688F3FF